MLVIYIYIYPSVGAFICGCPVKRLQWAVAGTIQVATTLVVALVPKTEVGRGPDLHPKGATRRAEWQTCDSCLRGLVGSALKDFR